MRVGWNNTCLSLQFWWAGIGHCVWSRVCFASHTMALHCQLRHHIWLPTTTREHSSLDPRVREKLGGKKLGRGKEEILKRGLKYVMWDWALPWIWANSPIAETKGADRSIKMHNAHIIPRNPTGYLPYHMGNNGVHNLDMEIHTFPAPCYLKLKT